MNRYDVIVIGGGSTGTAAFRDLSLRGFKSLLLEKGEIAAGTTIKSHQNLVGGMRYVIKDPITAVNCAQENKILSQIAPQLVDNVKNYFVGFGNQYTRKALQAAASLGVSFVEKNISEVRKEIPFLSKDIDIVIETEDKNFDAAGFCKLNCLSGEKTGGRFLYNTAIQKINRITNGFEILTEDEVFVTQFVINATGAWLNTIANKLDITVPVEYYQGTIVIRETLSHRGLQFFHEPEDADAYLVRNNEAWLGTTSVKIENPYSTISEPDVENFLTKKFSIILPEISKGAVHRKFVGIRALYKNIDSTSGRELTRDFKIIEQPEGFLHIIGGKLTTARLMAEKITDVVCEKSGVTSLCKTHLLPLV